MFALCLWIWLIGRSFGVPLVVTTPRTTDSSSYENPWQIAPSERGTSTLLISCFTTLFFAAWTAYHPNVPSANSGWGHTATRLQWVIMTAFAPEIALWSAWTQYRDARRLLNEINKALHARNKQDAPYGSSREQRWYPDNPQISMFGRTWPLDRDHEGKEPRPLVRAAQQKSPKHDARIWTIEQAFFASAGGLAVDSSSFSPHKSTGFTARGLLLLARCGLLPDLSLEEIRDKSKADAFSRVIACLQGAWFMAQTIARWVQGLPVSLLELHTFIHVFCAMCMYAIWWSKGYNIGQPLYTQDERILDLAALFTLEPLFARRGPYSTGAKTFDSTMQCSCQERAVVSAEMSQTAHQYPVKKLTSLRYLLTHLDDIKLGKQTVDRLKVGEQCRRADRALQSLRKQRIHLRWLEHNPATLHWHCDSFSLEFVDGPYTAHCAGNAVTEGAISWNDMVSSAFEPEMQVNSSKQCPYASQIGPNGSIKDGFLWHDPYRPWLPTPPVNTYLRDDPSLAHAATNYQHPARSRTAPDSPLPAQEGGLELRSLLKPAQTWSASSSPRYMQERLPASEPHPKRPAPVTGFYRKDLPSGLRKRDRYYHALHMDGIILVSICAAYSAAHLTAWNHLFPTATEMWIWRAFCLLFMTVPAASVWAASTFLMGRLLKKTFTGWKSGLWWNGLVVTIPSALLAQFYWMYIPARMGLLVLALMALRRPVEGTYEGVIWSQFVPHVG